MYGERYLLLVTCFYEAFLVLSLLKCIIFSLCFSAIRWCYGVFPPPPLRIRGGAGGTHQHRCMFIHVCLFWLRHSYIRIWASQRPSFHPYSSVPSPGCLSQIPDYGSGSQSVFKEMLVF